MKQRIMYVPSSTVRSGLDPLVGFPRKTCWQKLEHKERMTNYLAFYRAANCRISWWLMYCFFSYLLASLYALNVVVHPWPHRRMTRLRHIVRNLLFIIPQASGKQKHENLLCDNFNWTNFNDEILSSAESCPLASNWIFKPRNSNANACNFGFRHLSPDLLNMTLVSMT